MKNRICLSLADINFNIYSNEKIIIPDAFRPFLNNKAGDGININVATGFLPEINALPDFKSETREYFDSFSRVRTSYYDFKKKKYVEYAVFEKNGRDDYTLYYDLDGEITLKGVFDGINYPSVLLDKDIALMHASFSIINGQAVLFTGVSGAGKTTQSLLWQKYRNADMINGDRTALKISDGQVTAYGIPFCGSSKTAKNASAPLNAVVFPVKSQVNKAVFMDKADIVRSLIGNFTYLAESAEESRRMWSFSDDLYDKTKFIKLYCTPDENAVKALENIL